MPTNWLKNRVYPSVRLSRLWALEKNKRTSGFNGLEKGKEKQPI
jgi:hypothetical protein